MSPVVRDYDFSDSTRGRVRDLEAKTFCSCLMDSGRLISDRHLHVSRVHPFQTSPYALNDERSQRGRASTCVTVPTLNLDAPEGARIDSKIA